MITVYSSPTCGKCKVLKTKLSLKGIEFEECQDVTKMESMGIESLPMLGVGDRLLTFEEAIKYVNER